MPIHPEGYYDAQVVDHGISKTGTMKDQLSIKFQTVHGFVYKRLYFTEKGLKYTIQDLQTLGYTGRTFADMNETNCLVGKEANIKVEHEKYISDKGEKTTAKVSYINAKGSQGGGEAKREEGAMKNVCKFDALLRKANPETEGLKIETEGDIPF